MTNVNYYIQGDAAKAEQIKAAFERNGIDTSANSNYGISNLFYYSYNGEVAVTQTRSIINLIKTHPDYKELELPVEPKFKAEDRIVSKSDKSTIYRIIDLHEERMEYIVEIEHEDYHESCPWIAFEDQDDYELAPKKHYDISNFHAGMPVLVRWYNTGRWRYSLYSFYEEDSINPFDTVKGSFTQCIPFNDYTKHLLGTTGMPSEEYINW